MHFSSFPSSSPFFLFLISSAPLSLIPPLSIFLSFSSALCEGLLQGTRYQTSKQLHQASGMDWLCKHSYTHTLTHAHKTECGEWWSR